MTAPEQFSVHDQEGFEPVYVDDEMVQIRKGSLRALIEVATGSAAWASSYVYNEEVEIVREVAPLAGMDPAAVTPARFVCTYEFGGAHDFQQAEWSREPLILCTRCYRLQ